MPNKSIKILKNKFVYILKLIICKWFKQRGRRYQSLFDEKYYESLFKKHVNFKSISFEENLVIGSFKENSYLLKIRPRNLVESFIYIDGIWEPHIAKLISGYLNHSQSIIIDVGANIGATSIPIAKNYPNSVFYLFEPHPFIFKDLVNNISYNQLKNVIAINTAITDSPKKTMPFYAQKNAINQGLSSFELNYDIGEYEIINVNCSTLDSIFADKNCPVKVIKIDTQGHELNVLLSGKNLIEQDRPIIIFEFESDYFKNAKDEKNYKSRLLNFFSEVKYDLYMIDKNQDIMPKISLDSYFNGEIIAVPLAIL